jgi:hypothetical protein
MMVTKIMKQQIYVSNDYTLLKTIHTKSSDHKIKINDFGTLEKKHVKTCS